MTTVHEVMQKSAGEHVLLAWEQFMTIAGDNSRLCYVILW